MSENPNKTALLDLLDGIATGRLLEVFDRYYADDVVMSENGAEDPERVGKAKNRAYEEVFATNATWFGARLGDVVADGDTTGYRMWMDFEIFGNRITRDQWALQQWKDGQIVRETFFYKA